MNSGLTINQEKKIRADKRDSMSLADYKLFARVVQQYRRAQKVNGPGAAELRAQLIEEIDKGLKALGL